MASGDRRPLEATPQKLRVPRTPLESRQGYHPKKDEELVWKSPPSRQLSREKRVEYESDVRERFYDDYIGNRTTGTANNEVMTTTELSKLKFDPAIYRANALQGLVYDPARVVPRGVDLPKALRIEKSRGRQKEVEEHRKRRMSESSLIFRPQQFEHLQHFDPPAHTSSRTTHLPSIPVPTQSERPRSALQKTLDDSLNPEVVPAVESWFSSASSEEKDIAAKFFRTLSSHGKKPDPASRAALHRTRVRSAVMTPSRKQRQEKDTQILYQQMSREAVEGGGMSSSHQAPADPGPSPSRQPGPSPPRQPHFRRSNSGSEKTTAKGGMFATSTRQQPSHYTVHPDWASEASGSFRKK